MSDPVGALEATLLLSKSYKSTFYSESGKETVSGSSHNDLLNSNDDLDTLAGGQGDDSYIVYGPNDKIIEKGGEGTDTVRTWGMGYVLPANVENISMQGSWNSYAFGNSQGNRVSGNSGSNI